MKNPVIKRKRIEYRLTLTAQQLVKELSSKTGLGTSAVVETAIRNFAKKERLKVEL